MNTKQSMKVLKHKQQGATLFTSLVFLTLMTIVSVSAAKIASIDAIVAGNNQQQMLLFQQTAKTLKGFANPVRVVIAIQDHNGVNQNWSETLNPDTHTSHNAKREIKNRNINYQCKANGQAMAVGNDTAPTCYVFDLAAEDKLVSYGRSDKHYRGVGKMLPNTDNYTE